MKIPGYYKEYLQMTKVDLNRVETFRTIKKWKKGKCLDIGCGIGYITNFINGDGIDKNREAIIIAKTLYKKNNFFVYEIKNLNKFLKKTNKNYKTILCYNVIEHLTDSEIKLLFQYFYKFFDRNNIFIFGYSNPYNFLQLIVGFIRKKVLFDNTHYHNWTIKQFYKLINNNFEIIKSKKTSPFTRLIPLTKFFKGDILILAKLKNYIGKRKKYVYYGKI